MKKICFITIRKKIYEILFKLFGFIAILIACFCICVILGSIAYKGYKAFYSHYLSVKIDIPANVFPSNDPYEQNNIIDKLLGISFKKLSKNYNISYNDILSIISNDYYINIKENIIKNKRNKTRILKFNMLLNSSADMYLKKEIKRNDLPISEAKTLDYLTKKGIIKKEFNYTFFHNSDSRYPAQAGINGAIKGSIVTILLTLFLSFIVGITTAIHLELYSKKSKFKSFLEININNLAAVPSIIFGLLGLILFQNFMGIPRSSPLLASLVLSLMILPTIIISSQLALRRVPGSIKESAYGIGASKNQVIFSHILPFAFPGILTGVIIAISRAIGETAPLLIIGMFAFISNGSFNLLSSATTLPVQILMWYNMPEKGYTEKASAAILILLIIMITINILASFIRKRLEKKL